MKLNKSAYLFAAALVAGTVGMTSCSSEEVIDATEQGVENKVTLALSAAGVSSRSTSDEVNFGNNYQQIDNVVVVPMIGDAYQNPIKFGNFTPGSSQIAKETRTLSSNINRFKVYGNVCDGYVTPAYSALSETGLFTSLTFQAPTWTTKAPATDGSYSKPHELYYYYDTEGKGFKTSTSEWPAVGEPSWADLADGTSIGKDTKSIKIGAVNYAVGVLAAMIKNGDTTTKFYSNQDCTEGEKTFTNSLTVTGIIIYGQAKSFDADFTASEEKVNVYETAANSVINTGDESLSNSQRTGGNIYSVVAPTTSNTVSLNIEFTVAEGVYFKLADGITVMKPGDKLYLPVVLSKDNATSGSGQIFEADMATFLNATVKNWGLGSTTPVETSDVTVGVEFDVKWGEGYLFNMDI